MAFPKGLCLKNLISELFFAALFPELYHPLLLDDDKDLFLRLTDRESLFSNWKPSTFRKKDSFMK